MSVTYGTPVALSSPVVDGLDWSGGLRKIIIDKNSGDLLYWDWSSGGGVAGLFVSTDQGSTFTKVATRAANMASGMPDVLLSFMQGSSGLVHVTAHNFSTHIYYYLCFRLLYLNGHVSGYTVEYSPLALPDHTIDNTSDPRGDITVAYPSGVETPVWFYQGEYGTGATFAGYTGYISVVAGTPSSVGLDGTGTDTQVYTQSVGTIISNHNTQAFVVYEPTSGALIYTRGPFNSDYFLGTPVTQDTQYDLKYRRFAASGNVWSTAASETVLYTLPGGGADEPQMLGVYGVAGKACVLYFTQASGLAVGYFNSSGTWNTWVTLDSQTGRSWFATFATDGTEIFAAAHRYASGAGSGTPTGSYYYYNGSTVTTGTLTGAGAEMFGGSNGSFAQFRGVVFVRGDGSTLAQTTTGRTIGVAFIPRPTITQQPSNQAAQSGGTATFTIAATASSGSNSYQWQTNTGSGWTNAGTNSTSFTTGTLSSGDNGTTVRCTVTDSNDSITSSVVTLQVLPAGANVYGAVGSAAFGAGGFGAPGIRFTTGGAAAALAGNAQDVVTAAGALSTAIQLAANATDTATAAGALTTNIRLAGNAQDVATATANLTAAIKFAANAIATANASGALTTAILLAGSASDTVTGTGSLGGSAAALAGSAIDTVTATGQLITGIPLIGSAVDVVISTGQIVTGIVLGGSASDTSTATGSLSTAIKLGANAVDVVTASGQIVTGIPLIGNAQAVATASGGLTAQIQFAAAAQAIAIAAGQLTTQIQLAANAIDTATATGSLNSGALFSGAAQAISVASGQLSTAIQLLGAATDQATAAGALTTGIKLGGNAVDTVTATGALQSNAAALVGAAQSIVTAIGVLTTGIPLGGGATVVASANGALSTSIKLFGAAQSAVTAQAALTTVALYYASALTIRAQRRDYTVSLVPSDFSIALRRRDFTVTL